MTVHSAQLLRFVMVFVIHHGFILYTVEPRSPSDTETKHRPKLLRQV